MNHVITTGIGKYHHPKETHVLEFKCKPKNMLSCHGKTDVGLVVIASISFGLDLEKPSRKNKGIQSNTFFFFLFL